MARKRLAVDTRPLLIIGVDPGKATGIVVYGNGKIIARATIAADAVAPWVTARVLEIGEGYRIIFGIERYVFGVNAAKKSRQLDALKVTGQLESVAKSTGAEVKMINQSDSKKLASDTTLRSLGWWVTDPEGHMNDGARVALTTLAQVSATEFTRMAYGVVE